MSVTLQSTKPADEFGLTVADALAFLGEADAVLIGVSTSLDWPVTYLGLAPHTVIASIAAYPVNDPMPCEWHPTTKELVIGSPKAVSRAMERT